jgi:Xaa-Pro dipeptidase
MSVIDQTVSLGSATVERVQTALRARGHDAWALYNFRDQNPIASRLLGLPALSRRYVVLIPAEGVPIALTHRIEQQPWEGWLGERRVYLSWREFEAQLASLFAGHRSVAVEYCPRGAVPYVDLVPAGMLEVLRECGIELHSSADLVSIFYACWTPAGEASHYRAAAALHETVRQAFRRIAGSIRDGEELTEWELRQEISDELRRRGLRVGADSIVAVNANAANPHYAPTSEFAAPIRRGDLVLIDLWGKEDDDAIFADQTWMAYVGAEVPDRLAGIWAVLREARDAAVELLETRHRGGRIIAGFEVDDAAREVIRDAGYGEYFLHRTGHSIDRELHGSGPNLDNLETRDSRDLIPRVGFSVEPGIYISGDVGFRSEINMFMDEAGPVVTTPEPQRELFALLAE